ncbi:uroporphyrinogen-III synthase [Aquabacter cavernae]|uniref:uroporphyrinogen-III synthase n=1 Tax=Aquabacter cavernae TaxID=2496029 RepID=UPI000F8EABDD|nr:uroporphyrinogen-III synthase [Aquabacter cavernae]
MRLLLTRPEPGASRTAARLRGMGHEVLADPMLCIVPVAAPVPPGRFDALAFTSANGVRAFAARPPGLPVYAVGTRTGDVARDSGFSPVTDCAGDVDALAARLAADFPPGARILHAAGADRAGDLAALVASAGLEIVTLVVYRAEAADALAPETRAALTDGAVDGVLHFSPRTAVAVLSAVAAAGLMEPFARLRHFCLSAAVAAVLAPAGIAARVAPVPEEEALLSLLSEGGGAGGEVAPEGLPV